LCDQIDVALVSDLRRPVELFAQDFACFLSGFYSGFEIVFSHREYAGRSASSAAQHANAFSTLPPAPKKKLRPRQTSLESGCFLRASHWHQR
jgi:hypothetical protein